MPVTPDDFAEVLNTLKNDILASSSYSRSTSVSTSLTYAEKTDPQPSNLGRPEIVAPVVAMDSASSYVFDPNSYTYKLEPESVIQAQAQAQSNTTHSRYSGLTGVPPTQTQDVQSVYKPLDVESKFNITYGDDMSWDGMVGFEIAADIWSRFLQDDVKINIHVQTSDELPEQVVGGALPGLIPDQKVKDLKDYLKDDQSSFDDEIAVNQLPEEGDKLRVIADRYQLKDAKRLDFTSANAKALDVIDGDSEDLDGLIVMNRAFQWNYEDHPTEGKIDFVSVALHEIGHILGFVSGVDDPGWLTALYEARDKAESPGDLTGKDPDKDKEYEELGKKNEYVAFPLDFFRYSNDSTSWKEDYIDLTIGGSHVFFSIDGQEKLANLSTGKLDNGYGYQASHWKQGSNMGIMDPFITSGERKYISALDLTALDVVGWDVDKTHVDQPEWSFEHLVLQAHVRLAERLSVQPEWLVANKDEAVQQLRSDRFFDIEEMLYEGRRRNNRRKTITNWQEVLAFFAQEAYFSELGGNEWDAYVSSFAKTVQGTGDGETLKGGRAGDSVFGRRGSDDVEGRRGDDQLRGNRGADLVMGGGGADRVSGGQGHDVLDGGRGDDRLRGGDGSDRIVGNWGRDWLDGGDGADIFVLQPGQGADIVRDFVIGEDSVGLLGNQDVATQIADLTILAEADDVMIQQNNRLVMTLKNLNLQDQSMILNDPAKFFTLVELPVAE